MYGVSSKRVEERGGRKKHMKNQEKSGKNINSMFWRVTEDARRHLLKPFPFARLQKIN
jgi:hypothetical protein